MKKLGLILLILVSSFLLFVFVFGNTTIKVPNEKKVKSFSESHFYKTYYNTHNLILINAWATWCAPCIAEFPILEKISHNNKDLKFISISVDEDISRLKNKLKDNLELNKRDITLMNIDQRDSIYRKIKLIDPLLDNSAIKVYTKMVPYVVLIKNKKILYQANENLDLELLQKIIDENIKN